MSAENWKHFGALFTGIGALITASIPIASCLMEVQEANIKNVNSLYYSSPTSTPKKQQYALILDSDGWVNLRVGPSVNSPVITRIENNYRVEILNTNANWARVKTSLGDTGYIYLDRLVMLD